jgi:hypothetical protein
MPDIAKSRATRKACTVLCIAAGLPLSGCFFKKPNPPRTFVPPPPVAAKVAPVPQALNLPEPGEDFSSDIEYTKIVTVVSLPPAPVKPTPAKPATAAKTPPATAEPVITPPIVTPNPTGPKPTTIISATERQQMERELEDRLKKVKEVLERVGGRNLPKDLAELRDSARSFSDQAGQARERDLQAAVGFAKRAEYYANDLSSRIP